MFSLIEYPSLTTIDDKEAMAGASDSTVIYYLTKLDPSKSRRSFAVSDPSLLFLISEGITLLQKEEFKDPNIPLWILDKVNTKEVMAVNTNYENWKEIINYTPPKKWRVNVLGLGDVGGTLLTGLRLVAGDSIAEIGIFARSEDTIKRWEIEMNQVISPFESEKYPEVKGVSKDELFNCDMFVFCASKSVPPVGSDVDDVRMIQFKGNSQIITEYAKMARDNNFKGIFAVVSDPVDLLCKVTYLESNKDSEGNLDYKGLAPEQIRGYGLGVMNARACYYAKQSSDTEHYLQEGRAYGPHGDGLIIADSINNYNDELSLDLTEKAQTANLAVREVGFKPYIAPALSSGTLSILATIRGDWHYSATYMGGTFIGANNRNTKAGVELERLDLPNPLIERLENTYRKLEEII